MKRRKNNNPRLVERGEIGARAFVVVDGLYSGDEYSHILATGDLIQAFGDAYCYWKHKTPDEQKRYKDGGGIFALYECTLVNDEITGNGVFSFETAEKIYDFTKEI